MYKERRDLSTAIGRNRTTIGGDHAGPAIPDAPVGQPGPPPGVTPTDVDFVEGYFSSHGGAFLVQASGVIAEAFEAIAQPGKVRIPTDYYDAINDPMYGKQWLDACAEEFRGKFLINKSWVYEDLPHDRKAVKSKWVFKVEYNDDGTIARFKARIVACGYSQIEGVDWKEKFASALCADSCRMFLFDACQCNHDILEADVVKAFTHASLDEEIYMRPPVGFEQGSKVCRLTKCVEGLKH